jgi:hypothetical protein
MNDDGVDHAWFIFNLHTKSRLKLHNTQLIINQTVPDRRSQVHEVVLVRRTINLGTGNLEWGGVEKGEVSLRVT